MIKIGDTLIFNIKEIADKFGLTTTTIRRYIKKGRINGQKVRTKWYISEEAIADFFRQPYFKPKSGKGLK